MDDGAAGRSRRAAIVRLGFGACSLQEPIRMERAKVSGCLRAERPTLSFDLDNNVTSVGIPHRT